MKIDHIDRYYSEVTGEYTFYVHYESGDIDMYGGKLPKEASRFTAVDMSDFQFMQNKRGEYFSRWSKK